ncbi:MAG: class I SAM-dependent methyltransferase [Planctomycetota bacterium]|jgi:ubiquinone/menaquinone biosynthesis C-methylase UbiE
MNRTILITIVSLVAFTGCRSTPTRSDVPENINARYLADDMNVEEWTDRFEGESREIFLARNEIAEAVHIEPGMDVADVGAGTGLFLAPFSRAAGHGGTIHALDISPAFIDHMKRRAKENKLDNVEVKLSREDSIALPRNCIDVAFACDTYHHFEYHEAMLASIFESLKPGGRLVIVDFERIPGTSREWILGHVRAGKEEVMGEVTGAGFEFIREESLPQLEENYFIEFRKP